MFKKLSLFFFLLLPVPTYSINLYEGLSYLLFAAQMSYNMNLHTYVPAFLGYRRGPTIPKTEQESDAAFMGKKGVTQRDIAKLRNWARSVLKEAELENAATVQIIICDDDVAKMGAVSGNKVVLCHSWAQKIIHHLNGIEKNMRDIAFFKFALMHEAAHIKHDDVNIPNELLMRALIFTAAEVLSRYDNIEVGTNREGFKRCAKQIAWQQLKREVFTGTVDYIRKNRQERRADDYAYERLTTSQDAEHVIESWNAHQKHVDDLLPWLGILPNGMKRLVYPILDVHPMSSDRAQKGKAYYLDLKEKETKSWWFWMKSKLGY